MISKWGISVFGEWVELDGVPLLDVEMIRVTLNDLWVDESPEMVINFLKKHTGNANTEKVLTVIRKHHPEYG